MTFSGLTEAYDADLTVDWTEVRKHQSFNTGATVYFVSADVELAFDRLRRDNAIKLRSSGTDASMEALLQTVYNKLLELMFRPVEPEKAPDATRGSVLDALDKLLDAKGAMGGTREVRLRRQPRVSAEGPANHGHEHAQLQSPVDRGAALLRHLQHRRSAPPATGATRTTSAPSTWAIRRSSSARFTSGSTARSCPSSTSSSTA